MTDHRAEVVDAAGTPLVAAPAAYDPEHDAVDGSEPKRRNLNAQTRVIRHCPHCGIRPSLSGEPNCYCDPDNHDKGETR